MRTSMPLSGSIPRSRKRRQNSASASTVASRRISLLVSVMPSAEPAGKALFLKRWLRRPFAMGAVVPSGRLLAEAMACRTVSEIQGHDGHVIELGAGTGQVTKALLAAGIPGDRLALVERDPELAAFLRRHFRGPKIIEGDAARLPRLLAAHGVDRVAAVVSSLPLLSLP